MNKTKLEKKKEKTASQRKQNRQEKFYYGLFIICSILFVASYWFQPLTIGNDIRHTIFIVLFPMVTGLILFIIYRKKIINTDSLAAVKNKWHKLGYSVIIFLCVSLFSYLTIGVITDITWQCANHYSAKNQKQHTVTLPVHEFHVSKGSRISRNYVSFYFQENKEQIKVSRDFINQYKMESNASIQLKIRKGLWNHYLVDDWEIIK